jgi:hypothetical protein
MPTLPDPKASAALMTTAASNSTGELMFDKFNNVVVLDDVGELSKVASERGGACTNFRGIPQRCGFRSILVCFFHSSAPHFHIFPPALLLYRSTGRP